jgi:hypothetical protein
METGTCVSEAGNRFDPQRDIWQWLEPELWRARSVGGYRCVFLNSRDNGKPKGFGFASDQLDWLVAELATADRAAEPAVLFMHTYPSELGESAPTVQALMRQRRVLMVDMGHTHYNEIANDSRTIYAATAPPDRSRKVRSDFPSRTSMLALRAGSSSRSASGPS